jgi:hypothetical protein
MNSPDSPASVKKKKKGKTLLKVNTKAQRKKARFKELTFVDPHVETFYVGLNDDIHGAYNPVKANLVDIDEAPDIVRNWVRPDSQLVKSHHKYISTKSSARSNQTKIKPLKFVDDDNAEIQNGKQLNLDNKQTNDDDDDNVVEDFQMADENFHIESKQSLLNNIFDQINTTQMNDRNPTLLTPKRYKIFVQDTPDEYYGNIIYYIKAGSSNKSDYHVDSVFLLIYMNSTEKDKIKIGLKTQNSS